MIKFSLNQKLVQQKLSEQLKILIDAVLGQKTDISKESEVKINNNSFEIYLNDYIENLYYGRKPKAERIPIDVIIKWLRGKGVSGSLVTIAYKIQESIYQNGIKGNRAIYTKLEKGLFIIIENIMDLEIVNLEIDKIKIK